MTSHLVDTHALVWQFTDPSSLSVRVASILDAAEQAKGRILVPSIVLVELVYLAERRRVPEVALTRTFDLLGVPRGTYRSVPLNLEIARMLGRIDRSIVPDMPDRIIAATSMALKVPVLTKDSRLKALTTIETIW
jgi:PIN domain nuclease of toxin-antitoxin system